VKLLLDTHVVLWLLGDPDRIAVAVRRDIEDVSNAVIISAVSAWEIATKHAIGKLPLPESPQALLDRAVVELRAVELAITRRHALRSASLPSHHRDPMPLPPEASAPSPPLSGPAPPAACSHKGTGRARERGVGG